MRTLIVHTHFHQPPRENAPFGTLVIDPTASPAPDWTTRITNECYGPNASVPIYNAAGIVEGMVNNYAHFSFNIGPLLMRWLAKHSPITLRGMIEGDKLSRIHCDGHGNAFALAGNHMILPLASERDILTQIRWSKRSFEQVFGRPTEGMWLPEAAVDHAALEALIAEDIKFTVLAPNQARSWRFNGSDQWNDNGIDSGHAYTWRSRIDPTKSIAIFFYDGPISSAVAFENLARNGDKLIEHLLRDLPEGGMRNIATDGESWGHHTKEGQRGAAWAFNKLRFDPGVQITNYGHFLAQNPAGREVEIWQNSSWSCAHGIERWRSDCGCCGTPGKGLQQRWRGPLREALDFLRDHVDLLFESRGADIFTDPWGARDAYIDVFMDPDKRLDFVAEWFKSEEPSAIEIRQGFDLLELQRHRMFMYTSCAWFFDDISGIEPGKMLEYAYHVIELANRFGLPLEDEFVTMLARAESNQPEVGNGANFFNKSVKAPVLQDELVSLLHGLSSVDGAKHLLVLMGAVGLQVEDHNREEWGKLLLRTYAQLNADTTVPVELRGGFEKVCVRLRVKPALLGWCDAGGSTMAEDGFSTLELGIFSTRDHQKELRRRRAKRTGTSPKEKAAVPEVVAVAV